MHTQVYACTHTHTEYMTTQFLTCCLVETLHYDFDIGLKALLMALSYVCDAFFITCPLHPRLLQNILLRHTIKVVNVHSIYDAHCNKLWEPLNASTSSVEILQRVGYCKRKKNTPDILIKSDILVQTIVK